jgi:subtilisin
MRTFEHQLKSLGHARVMAVLRHRFDNDVVLRGQQPAQFIQESQDAVANRLMPLFSRFDNSRSQLIFEAKLRKHQAMVAGDEGTALTAAEPPPAVLYFRNLGVLLGTVDAAGLTALTENKRDIAVLTSPPDLELIRPGAAGAALAGMAAGPSWALEAMRIPQLWAQGLRGQGVTVGHIDTGVDAGHPALAGAVAHFAQFDYHGRPLPQVAPRDTAWHGTHTAGLIVGRTWQGSQFGTAPEATLACGVVIEGGDTPARVLAGLDWCVDRGCRVINVSLGTVDRRAAYVAIVKILRARDILMIVAIGNEGPHTSRSPGNNDDVLSVGAAMPDGAPWDQSSSQSLPGPPARVVPHLLAPGTDLWSCTPDGLSQQRSGTSMATPHVSGLAALLLQAKPTASANELQAAILGSCADPPPGSTFGGTRGIPDAPRALERLQP